MPDLNFSQATYLSQVRRLRRLAELALSRYSLKSPKLHFINHGENCTFRVETGKSRYLLRIHRQDYHTRAAMEEELHWLHRLGKQERVLAPNPVKSKQGRFLEEVSVPEVGPRFCSLLEWVDGRFLDLSATPKHFHLLGQLLAELHRSNTGIQVRHRRYWDAQGLLGPKPKFGGTDKIDGLKHKDQETLTRAAKEIFARLRKFERKFPERQGLIHADLHFRNFVVQRDRIGAIDFDDCGFGFHAYDLVMPLIQGVWLAKKKGKPVQLYLDAIQNGYSSIRSWDQQDEKVLPLLYAARKIVMVGWLQSRADNPKFKEVLPKRAKLAVDYLKGGWDEIR